MNNGNPCSNRVNESSASIRQRVQAARDIQLNRFSKDQSEIVCNADTHVGEIRQFCRSQAEGIALSRAEASNFDTSGDIANCFCKSSTPDCLF